MGDVTMFVANDEVGNRDEDHQSGVPFSIRQGIDRLFDPFLIVSPHFTVEQSVLGKDWRSQLLGISSGTRNNSIIGGGEVFNISRRIVTLKIDTHARRWGLP